MSEIKEQPNVELSQDDVSNDMTRSILKRNGVETATQDDKTASEKETEDNKVEPAKVVEPEQVVKQEQPVVLTEDDIKALEDAGISEESLDGKTVEEIKIIAQGSGKKQDVDETSQEQTSVSEEEALKAGGFAGNLIGKGTAELLEIINNQSVHIGTQNEKLANPKQPVKEVDSLNQQNLDTEESKVEDTTSPVDLLHLSPEEQEKRLNAIIDQRVDAGIKKGLTESPEMVSVREQASQNHMVQFHTELGKHLPEGVTTPEQAEEVFNAWKVAVKDVYSNDDLLALAKTPNVLITLISDHYVINSKPVVDDSVTDLKVKKSGAKSYQRIRDMIKNAPAGQATFNYKRKATEDNESDLISNEGSDSQQMMGRILAKHIPK